MSKQHKKKGTLAEVGDTLTISILIAIVVEVIRWIGIWYVILFVVGGITAAAIIFWRSK